MITVRGNFVNEKRFCKCIIVLSVDSRGACEKSMTSSRLNEKFSFFDRAHRLVYDVLYFDEMSKQNG